MIYFETYSISNNIELVPYLILKIVIDIDILILIQLFKHINVKEKVHFMRIV